MTTENQPAVPPIWSTQPASSGALRGIRIVDLSRVLAGPLCTQMLADHGADIIKIEPPQGDETRQLGPPFDTQGTAAYFNALNRGKRTLSLNLATDEDRDVLLSLLEQADVLVENFLPGTMEKWGLGYESTLSQRFPKLIYCSITGFGTTGPLGGLPGYDAVLQAICGIMSINGSPESGPTRVGIPVVDHLTAYTALSGILMALLARERTGRAQRVEATLFDTALSLLVPHAANWMASGTEPRLLGSAHPNIAPYDSFRTRDGHVFLGILNDNQFTRLCHQIHREDLATDPRFQSNAQRLRNRDALKLEIENAFMSREKTELCDVLMKNGIPAGPVNTVPEALNQAHAHHRGMVVQRSDYQGLGLPVRLHATPGVAGSPPPAFNQHASIKDVLSKAVTKIETA